MPKVTVILPSLNVKDYIEETLESVCNQTLKDIEILCVDAGSTDGTEEIIKEYEEKDSRVHLIHSDIRSYGHQMNMGIHLAKGEYIGIVETDDYIDSNMYKDLYFLAKENNLDIVKSNYRYFVERKNGQRYLVEADLSRDCNVEYGKVFSCDDYIDRKYRIETYIWDGLYRRDFLVEKDIKFNESPGASYQDFGFKFQTGLQAQRIMVTKNVYYNYRKDNSNSSTYNPNGVAYNLRESVYILDKLQEQLRNNKRMYGTLANEIFNYGIGCFTELCHWMKPDNNVKEAIQGYVSLIKDFKRDGVYLPEIIGMSLWKQTELMRQDVDVFMKSIWSMSQAEARDAREFVSKCAEVEQVVIFGSGLYGKCALTFLRACREGENIVAFVDNNPAKKNTYIDDIVIEPIEECISKYDALYAIASPSNYTSMRKQLEELGVNEDRIISYNYSSLLATCAGGIDFY